MNLTSFRFPTAITFGPGAIAKLPEQMKSTGIKRALVVTDKGLAPLAPVARIKELCQESGVDAMVYSDPVGNPVKSHVSQGVEAYHAHRADGLVIIGGGCALDVGKAIALMASHPGELFDYEDGLAEARPMDQKIPPMIAIPTTAGTGSEVGGSSVIADEKSHRKVIIWGTPLLPPSVIADPELTTGLPAAVTAATGVDALTHCLEAYIAQSYHPMCEGIAVEGIRLVKEHLYRAVSEANHIDARSGMLMASMMGAVAFQKGLGVTHSCAHALSACFDLHHGLANAVMLEACMRFNQAHVGDRFARLARWLGLESEESFFGWLKELNQSVGIPDSLGKLGVTVTEELIQAAMADPCHQSNPRACKASDFEDLFTRCL